MNGDFNLLTGAFTDSRQTCCQIDSLSFYIYVLPLSSIFSFDPFCVRSVSHITLKKFQDRVRSKPHKIHFYSKN